MASGKIPQGPPSTSWGRTAAHFDKGAAINSIQWGAGPGTMEPADLEGGVRRDQGMQPLNGEQAAAQRRRRLWFAAASIALLLIGIGIGIGIGYGVSKSDGGNSDPPPQEDNTQNGGGQPVAPTPAGQPTAPTPAGPPTVPTPAVAAGTARPPPPQRDNTQTGGGQPVTPTPARQATAPTPAGPPTVPTPAMAAGRARPPPPQGDNTQSGGGQPVAPTPARQPTARTPAGPPSVPTPAAAAGSVREGGPCELDAECGAVNSTCIKLVANAAKKPPGICTSLAPDGAACEESGGCFSGECDIGGFNTGSDQCLITLGEPCSTDKQCAGYAVQYVGNNCVEGLCTEPPED